GAARAGPAPTMTTRPTTTTQRPSAWGQSRFPRCCRTPRLSCRGRMQHLDVARNRNGCPGRLQLFGRPQMLLASRRLPGERLCERDREAIRIDADSQPDALACLLSRCADELRAPCRQFAMCGCEIVNREADRARPCQRLCGRPALTTLARSYQVEREGGGAGLKLAPPGRLEFHRQAEYVAVERDRAAHVRHIDLDVIDFAKHHKPPWRRPC